MSGKGFGHSPFGNQPFGTADFTQGIFDNIPEQIKDDDKVIANSRLSKFVKSLRKSINHGDGVLSRVEAIRDLKDPLKIPSNTFSLRNEGNVATGDGVRRVFSFQVELPPIRTGTLVVVGGSFTATDDGDGGFVEAGINGTISYSTGTVIVEFPSALTPEESISVSYQQVNNDPSLVDRLGPNYGVVIDAEEDERFKRAQINLARQLFVIKGSDIAYEARGDLSGFDVDVISYYDISGVVENGGDPEFLSLNGLIEEVPPGSGVHLTPIGPRLPNFDEVPGDVIILDKVEFEYGSDVCEAYSPGGQPSNGVVTATTFSSADVTRTITGDFTFVNGDIKVFGGGEFLMIEELVVGQKIRRKADSAIFYERIQGFVAAANPLNNRIELDTPYAGASSTGFATGTITTAAGAGITDGETFVIDDGMNPPVTFEMDDDAVVINGNVPVSFTGGDTANDVRDTIVAEIAILVAAGNFLVTTAASGAGVVNLIHKRATAGGNVGIVNNVVVFSVTGMSGGTRNAMVSQVSLAENVPDVAVFNRSYVRVSGNGLPFPVDMHITSVIDDATVGIEEHAIQNTSGYDWELVYCPRFYDSSAPNWYKAARVRLDVFPNEISLVPGADIEEAFLKLVEKFDFVKPAHVRIVSVNPSMEAVSNSPVIVV